MDYDGSIQSCSCQYAPKEQLNYVSTYIFEMLWSTTIPANGTDEAESHESNARTELHLAG